MYLQSFSPQLHAKQTRVQLWTADGKTADMLLIKEMNFTRIALFCNKKFKFFWFKNI